MNGCSNQPKPFPIAAIALEEMLLLWLANINPAFQPFKELFDDSSLARDTGYAQVTVALPEYFGSRPGLVRAIRT